ncbi:MAG: DUF2207 domain-containing protein [Actinobacteria bacterium]|nr:DUF2207 domain-containing protein [Actinomycetota bacterium]
MVALTPGAVATAGPIREARWTLGRAFVVNPATVSVSAVLLVLVAGAFGRLVWRRGRDRRYAGGPVEVAFGSPTGTDQAVPVFERHVDPVEFVPPDGLRPGQIGTLLDEVAHPLDVTATIVDLATRGYLTIEELPAAGRFAKPSWRLVKQ